jgi:polysaccharide export outer membrane protein
MKSTIHVLIVAMVALSLAIGCGPRREVVKTETPALPSVPQQEPEYVIQPGDQLDIRLFYNPELNEAVTVRPDGKISLQLLDDVQAAGLTPAELDGVLTKKYARELKQPVVTVIVRSFSGQRVYVGGEVNKPGLIDLTTGMTALQAVINAGGFRETAKPENAIVIRKGRDERPFPVRVDLNEALYGKNRADFQLQPYDIVYVPKTFIAKANKFVNEYIQQLLLFRGTSLGFYWELHRVKPEE